jgi:DNA replication and repair protein RecF
VRRTSEGEVQIKISGSPVRTVAELAEQLPLLVINSESFGLLTGSPVVRRQFLDWGVFHVEHRFFHQWQRFQRCIKQRNKLLRHGKMSGHELAVWTRELAASGSAIHEYRQTYFNLLAPRFEAIMARLAPDMEGLELRYRRGWDRQRDYREALEISTAADIEQGFTHVGPQRADLRVMAGGHLAAETLSRGQQKLVISGLKLAQGRLMADMGLRRCIYLIDDLPAELDHQHSALVCGYLAEMEAQIFLTCVQRKDILVVWPRSGNQNLSMFHVEHGSVEHFTPPTET